MSESNKDMKVKVPKKMKVRIDEQFERLWRELGNSRYWEQIIRDEKIKAVNKAVFDAAEKFGVSIYDVCFNYGIIVDYVPEVGSADIKLKISFVPLDRLTEEECKMEEVEERFVPQWERLCNAMSEDEALAPKEDVFYVTHDQLVRIPKEGCTLYSIPLADLLKLPTRE